MRRLKNGTRSGVLAAEPGHVEDARALEEERALLREEQREARQVDLPRRPPRSRRSRCSPSARRSGSASGS